MCNNMCVRSWKGGVFESMMWISDYVAAEYDFDFDLGVVECRGTWRMWIGDGWRHFTVMQHLLRHM